jgi:NAD(P)-dependent dehydrogenase (short-subunit alcohol dehydrogenase family)
MGHRGAPGASLYTASKHAVEGLTKSAALEGAASGIRVNPIAPGPVETELLNRFTGTAERKAGLVAGVPFKRVGTPRRSRMPSCSSLPAKRRSSRPGHQRQWRQDRFVILAITKSGNSDPAHRTAALGND